MQVKGGVQFKFLGCELQIYREGILEYIPVLVQWKALIDSLENYFLLYQVMEKLSCKFYITFYMGQVFT